MIFARMKILFVIPKMEIAGTERQLHYLAAGLKRRGHDVGIVCVRRLGRMGEILVNEGFDVRVLGFERPYDPRIVKAMEDVLAAFKPDILQTFLFGFHLWTGLAGRRAKVPFIVSSRRELPGWKKWYHALYENIGNCSADAVVCNSRAVESFVLKTERNVGGKTRVIHNGIPERAAPGSDTRTDGIVVIGMVANFYPQKEQSLLLEAVGMIKRRFPGIRVRFAGGGLLMDEVKRRSAALGLNDIVEFLGVREDVFDLLGSFDIFVHASKTEGFPNVVMEALMAQRPVVASRVGGIPEIIDEGKTGILVPASDAGALAGALIWCVEHPAERAAMGRRGRESVLARFSVETMVSAYEGLYNERLKQKAKAVDGRRWRERPKTENRRQKPEENIREQQKS